MIVLGIDPGLSGGVAVVDSRSMEIVIGMRVPVFKWRTKKLIDVPVLHDFLSGVSIDTAVIENVGSMPGQGHVGAFTFGRATGAIEGLAMLLTPKVEWVTPQKWKKHFGLSKDKQASIDTAKKIFGDSYRWQFKADDGIAEAALMARWLLDQRAKMG
jgi:crossover junction endodeoxyribonuclease RuvC